MKKRMHTFSSGDFFVYCSGIRFESVSKRAETAMTSGIYRRLYGENSGNIILTGKTSADDSAYVKNMLHNLSGRKIDVTIDGVEYKDMVILSGSLDFTDKSLLGNFEMKLGWTDE